MEKPKRARKANWVPEEISVLLHELQTEGPTLFSKNTLLHTAKAKAATWQRIADSVSALGHAMLTAEEVRLQWKRLRKDVMEKDREARMTGLEH